ncbi:S8 family serine peptidase [Cohnella sp. REN36]|uniref:S8 family serine peptidase n=1 Tax=Cohnella sp. REN36 TaxID=2887347 RepID=UPI001D157971|nr:S8 family serine peptidase [Cohnella sp. REN36]MCC3377521.1 S8 family serine peptidase [Cohnella sp. REN36]
MKVEPNKLRTAARRVLLGLLPCLIATVVPSPPVGTEEPRNAPALEAFAQAEASQPASAAAARDPAFLETIGIPDAWKQLQRDVTGTIAIVDTGIDLKHPALSGLLTDGVNLLSEGKPPQDDNGHGTAVAGVIAAIARAAETSGGAAAWQAKLMPIKALDRNGEGDEDHLARGIRYAIDHGADIVVLSLGLRRDAPQMREVVRLAESKGVLLVAASGNDAATFGGKAAVQYPAAYPTVLSVAGADGRKAQGNSTGGPEIDLAAAWQVDTLAPGGGATVTSGTSMAAPQAAGALALLRAVHPDWKPVQLRETMRRTAEDISAKGWDRATGYGLLRADLAVAASEAADWREPNGSRASASPFPIGTEVLAAWSGADDADFYFVDVPYDGRLSAQATTLAGKAGKLRPSLALYAESGGKALPNVGSGALKAEWKVAKGKYYMKAEGSSEGEPLTYRLESGFRMAPDAMEPNNSALAAYTLAPRSQRWTGTFDTPGDEDWTVVTLPRAGTLKIVVNPDTTRIDPAVTVRLATDAKAQETDENGDGEPETVTLKDVKAGKYYIRIRNAVSDRPEPVIGTYTVRMEYSTPYEDPNEPNDGPLTATSLSLQAGASAKGLIDEDGDEDWFRFTLTKQEQLRIRLTGIPEGTSATLTLLDKQLNSLDLWSSDPASSGVQAAKSLEAGTYYLKLEADHAFRSPYYQLSVQPAASQAGFRDTAGHWAEGEIAAVAKKGWMTGTAAETFAPDRKITRAEAIATLVRAAPPASGRPARMRFADVSAGHWAYGAIAEADAAGWLNRYDSGKLQPERLLTRAEAAYQLVKAKGWQAALADRRRFSDVPKSHWAAAEIETLAGKGWISGYADGTFGPERTITRAEWAVLLARLL